MVQIIETENPAQIEVQLIERIEAVIVEDIVQEADALKLLVEQHFPKISIVGIAHSPEVAINLILEKRPVLLFLDIRLGGSLESFDVINALYERGFKKFVSIFITGYGSEQYAIQALKYAAAAYLNKPIILKELVESVEVAQIKLLSNTFNFELNEVQIRQILEQLRKQIAPKTIFIDSLNGEVKSVEMSKVVCLRANDGMCDFVLSDNTIVKSVKGLKYYEEHFEVDYDFFRVHHHTHLNLAYLATYHHKKLKINLKINEKLLDKASKLGYFPLFASKKRGHDLFYYLKNNGRGGQLPFSDRFF
ncbi:MAG: response regulator [Flectobacillus sp.]|nr:response regulator [Flectobacillus sp.]